MSKEIKFHPLSEIFPLMPVSDIKELASDIKERGLQSAITLCGGEILDGRHRYEACRIAGVNPKFEDYKGDDPLAYVIAKNLKRRHLTTSQKAMVAATIEKMPHGGDRKSGKNQDANLHLDRSTAANSLDVSPRSVATASKILDESPGLAKQVNNGQISLHKAEEKLAEKRAKKEVQLDSEGRAVPEPALICWNRRQEAQDLLSAISKIKGVLNKAFIQDDILFREVNISNALAELGNAYTHIERAKPYAVCTCCQGQVPDKCTLCRGRGVISEFAWKTFVPKEIKEIIKKAAK